MNVKNFLGMSKARAVAAIKAKQSKEAEKPSQVETEVGIGQVEEKEAKKFSEVGTMIGAQQKEEKGEAPVDESAESAEVKKEDTTFVAFEKHMLDDCVERCANELFAINFTREESYKEIIHVYEKLISLYDSTSCFKAVKELTKIFLMNKDRWRIGCRWFSFELERNLWATLYVLSVKYNFDFVQLFASLFTLHNDTEKSKNTLVWSFDSFSLVCETAISYGYSLYEAQDTLKKLWSEFFAPFFDEATEESIKVLKEADDTWPNMQETKWADYIFTCLKANYNSMISHRIKEKKIPFTEKERKIYEQGYKHSGISGLATNHSKTYILGMARYYPELMDDACLAALHQLIVEISMNNQFFDCETKEYFGKELMGLLQTMADYKVYRSEEFCIKPLWKEILNVITFAYTGIELNYAVEILSKYFYVSEEEINVYIRTQTMYWIYGDIFKNYCPEYWNWLNEIERQDKISRFARLAAFLSNPEVFKVVAREKNSIIQVFSD